MKIYKHEIKAGVIGTSIFLAACSGMDTKSDPKELADAECFFKSTKEEAPNWVCTGNYGDLVTGRGSYKATNASDNLAFQIAQNRARADLARKLSLELKTALKDYESLTGNGTNERLEAHIQQAVKSELKMPIEGSRVYASVYGPDETLYMLVGLDEALKKYNFERAVQSSFKDAEALWTKEEAEKAYAELEHLLSQKN